MTDRIPPPPSAPRRRDRRAVTEVPRHGRLPRNSGWRGLLLAVAMVLAVVVVSAGSIAAITVYNLGTQIQDNAVDISSPDDTEPPQIGAINGSFNLLVVGVDNDVDQDAAYGEREGVLNDVNILLHVSADHTSATVVSIPRDLITDQPRCTNTESGVTSPAQTNVAFNSAMERGGLACVVNTTEELTGLDIPYAAQMSFNAVVEMTDAVGGVPVCLSDPIQDDYSGLNLPAGTSVISGSTALQFLRTRHGVGDGSDLSRISSQQVYMSSLLRQIKSDDTLLNFSRLYALANVAATNARLSESLTSIDTMVSMAQSLRTVNLETMALVQYPVADDPDFPSKVVPVEPLANELFAAILADQPVVLDDESLGSGSELNPDVPVEEPAPTADPTTPPDGTSTETPTPEPTASALGGIKGQTAQQETCSVGFSG
jgi:LCP family protein required for cell wall assembly